MRERREAARNQPAVRREPRRRSPAQASPLVEEVGGAVTSPVTVADLHGVRDGPRRNQRLNAQRSEQVGQGQLTRWEVRVAPHSSLLIGVQETASPFLRAGTVRQ